MAWRKKNPDRDNRKLLSEENRATGLLNFILAASITAIRECIDQLKPRLPRNTDPEALATYVLAVMEGGVMISRSYGSVDPFDRAVKQLRQHFALLLIPAKIGHAKPKREKSTRTSRTAPPRTKS